MGGWAIENLRWGCWWCHLVAMHTKGFRVDNQEINKSGNQEIREGNGSPLYEDHH
jgi:hypothetical protein